MTSYPTPDGDGGPSAPFDELLAAAQGGESWAFETLYRQSRTRITAFVAARGVTDVDDVVSETFVGVFRSLGRFRGGEAEFRSWLFRIARNKVTDWYRAQGRRPATVTFPPLLDPVGGDVEDEAAQELARADLVRLFDELTLDQAEVLLLRLVGELTMAQIAEVMDRTVGAVKAHQRRGLARLKEELDRPSSPALYPSGALER